MSTEKQSRPIPEMKNRKAGFEYFFLEKWIAGIELKGTEVKSIRAGKVQLTDAFCTFMSGELFVKDMHISEYTFGSYNNHEAKRPRKLLLKKDELEKMRKKVTEKGLTLIPVKLFINKRGLVKIEIALARGKQSHDKRDTIKDRDIKRDIAREL